EVKLDQLAADAEPFGVLAGQRRQLREQLPGPPPVGHRVLDLRRHGRVAVIGLDIELFGDRDLDVTRHLRADVLGQAGLSFPSHPDLDDSRTLRSKTVTLSPGPTQASAFPASADSP